MNLPLPTCLILGASTRAAATSAVRAGYAPICADQFVDVDLIEIAKVLPLNRYPQELVSVAKSIKPTNWFYTGALENSPDIIQKISEHHHLWGNYADVVQAVRDQKKIKRLLQTNHLPVLDLQDFSNPPSSNGEWMLKPKRSAGGREVMIWNAETKKLYREKLTADYYFQQRASGENYSALYLAAAQQVSLIGISQQLVGCDWLNSCGLTWCGNIAPVQFSHQSETDHLLMQQVKQTGTLIAKEFGLRGLFGIDYILDNQQQTETLYPIEVNPRYVASVELFEQAYEISLLKWHVAASESFQYRASDLFNFDNMRPPSDLIYGKVILYADRSFTFPFKASELPSCADIPFLGRVTEPNEPICTLFATGNSQDSCLKNLKEKSHQFYQSLK